MLQCFDSSFDCFKALLLALMPLVSIARMRCCGVASSALPHLGTWVLCRCSDASTLRFDTSMPRFDNLILGDVSKAGMQNNVADARSLHELEVGHEVLAPSEVDEVRWAKA